VFNVSSIVIEPPLSEILIKLSSETGKNVETFIVDLLQEKLDPDTRIRVYIALFKKFLKEARKFEASGDTVQASEKYWGAISSLLNIVGELKSLPHYKHSDYWRIMNVIIDETNDREFVRLFAVAEKLHANFYHNFIPKHQFSLYSEEIQKLVEKIIKYLKAHGLKINH